MKIIPGAFFICLMLSCQPSDTEKNGTPSLPVTMKIPESLETEHAALHEKLADAMQVPGRIGELSKNIASLLHPHFEKEEEYALPPLSILPALSDGKITPEMEQYIGVCDRLKENLPGMLDDHRQIKEKLKLLKQAATEENNAAVLQFAEELEIHAMNEEQILYPATVLVGEYLKLKFRR